MRKSITMLLLLLCSLGAWAQEEGQRHEVLFETSKGNIRVALYDETPLHRDNFLKLVKEGFYDGTLFHRVIRNFMIQGGDSTTRHAQEAEQIGLHSPAYTIPAEIRYPQLFHKRGALAAAREGDATNPERASSASQFYIVYGRQLDEPMLNYQEQRLLKATDGKVTLTPEVREAYLKLGGSPHLDGQYTVFGEVLEGMDVVMQIQILDTDMNDRPYEDVVIRKATVVK